MKAHMDKTITEVNFSMYASIIFYSLLTILIYQLFAKIQYKLGKVWINPMLLTILILITILLIFNIDYSYYESATKPLASLLEPAVVALGYPLYQQLHSIKSNWKSIVILLFSAACVVISISYLLSIFIIGLPDIAVSLSLKSITTPIGIALTEQLNGNNSITAFAIILAGLIGAIFGIKWLNFIKVTSAKAQGLAIGSASHALGTATISQLSYQHAAYSSLALILMATITAVIAPFIINTLNILINITII